MDSGITVCREKNGMIVTKKRGNAGQLEKQLPIGYEMSMKFC